MELHQSLLDSVLQIGEEAGEKIMQVYRRVEDVKTHAKEDGSPLTEADMLSHQHITQALKKLTPNLPVLSEESDKQEITNRKSWQCFWLVDPLDGTKEFIHRTDEFTVNIALIQHNQPVLGVVVAPALETSYYAMNNFGAYKKTAGISQPIRATEINAQQANYRVVASRRHGSENLEKFLAKLNQYELVQAGSALKICLVAEGKADIYPRLGPTFEWDTAAGHAIVNNASAKLYGKSGEPFSYNARDSLLNGFFVVTHKDVSEFSF